MLTQLSSIERRFLLIALRRTPDKQRATRAIEPTQWERMPCACSTAPNADRSIHQSVGTCARKTQVTPFICTMWNLLRAAVMPVFYLSSVGSTSSGAPSAPLLSSSSASLIIARKSASTYCLHRHVNGAGVFGEI